MEKGEPSWWSDAIEHFQNDDIMAECIKTYGTDGLKGRAICSTQSFVQSSANRLVSSQPRAFGTDLKPWLEKSLKIMCVNSRKKRLHHVELLVQKSGYILGLATDSEELLNFPYATSTELEVRKHLIRFKGVGPWTAEMVMIFALLLPDVYSPKDIGLVNAIKRLFPEVETMDEAEEVAKRWAPYRTMACWYLWRTLDPIPVEY